MDYDGQHHDGQQIPIVTLDQALLDEQKALGGHCEDFEDRNGDAEENLIVDPCAAEGHGYDYYKTKGSIRPDKKALRRRVNEDNYMDRLDNKKAKAIELDKRGQDLHIATRRQTEKNLYWMNNLLHLRSTELKGYLSPYKPSILIYRFDLPSLARHLTHELGIAGRQNGSDQELMEEWQQAANGHLDRLMEDWQQAANGDAASIFQAVGAELACAWLICNHASDIPTPAATPMINPDGREVETGTWDHVELCDRLLSALKRLV